MKMFTKDISKAVKAAALLPIIQILKQSDQDDLDKIRQIIPPKKTTEIMLDTLRDKKPGPGGID